MAEQAAAEQARLEAERIRAELASQQQALAELTGMATSVGLGAEDAQRFFDGLLKLKPDFDKQMTSRPGGSQRGTKTFPGPPGKVRENSYGLGDMASKTRIVAIRPSSTS
jgi:hypothetical protein